MKKSTFLLVAALLLGCIKMQAQTVDSTNTFVSALSGTEIVYAHLVYNSNGSTGIDANFQLKASDATIGAWTSASCMANFVGGVIYARDGAVGNVVSDTVSVANGDNIHLWFVLNVSASTYTLYAMNQTTASGVKCVYSNAGFRSAATSLTYWEAVHNASSSSNYLSVRTIETVSAYGTYPESYDTNANLSALNVSNGELSPAFSPDVLVYNVDSLPKYLESIDVQATAYSPNANVVGDGTITFSGLTATANVIVTPVSGSAKTYTVNFTKRSESDDATLKTLTITNGAETFSVPGFNSNSYNYSYSFSAQPSGIPTIAAEANDNTANVLITQATAVPGQATVLVTAENGTQATYTVNFRVNIIANWDGLGGSGMPTDYGWSYSGSCGWNTANGGSGVRYGDYGISSQYGTSVPYTLNGESYTSTRILWIRYSSDDRYMFAIQGLENCKTYKFSWKYGWHNNAACPTLIAGIYEAGDSVVVKEQGGFTCSETKRELTAGSMTFTTPANGNGYYLSIGNTVTWGDCMVAITDLVIEETTEVALEVSKTQQVFTAYTADNVKNIDIKGYNLTENVQVTAPAGITLTYGSNQGASLTIPAADFACGATVNIALAASDAETACDGDLVITTGSIADTVYVKYMANTSENLIGLAMGAGAGYNAGYEPENFGWQGITANNSWFSEPKEQKVATWTYAGSGSYGNRYDSVADFLSVDGDTIDSWALLLRWDGTGNTDSLTVYSYPVMLEAGKSYKLSSQHAWHSVGYETFLSFGINAERDNNPATMVTDLFDGTHDMYDYTSDGKKWYNMELDFDVPESGQYYLTICMHPEYASVNSQILAAFKDLSIRWNDGNALTSADMDNIRVYSEDRYVKVVGAENFKLYSIAGAELNPQVRQAQGVYLVTVNGKAYKVIVK